MEHHVDRVKFLMSEGRKQQHNPETVLNEAGVKKGMIIADLGSGPGFFTIPLAQMTGEKGVVYAVDSNQAMLNGLKENIAKSEVNPNIIKMVNSDVCHTQIPKESVDLVLFANVLHEVNDKKAFFQEVRRIAKATAYIVDVDWKKVPTEHGPPFKERLSEDEANQILAENGFSVIKQINVGPYHYEIICKPSSFKLDEGKLILEKPSLDAVAVFRKIAKQINCNEKIDSHQYEEELKARNPK